MLFLLIFCDKLLLYPNGIALIHITRNTLYMSQGTKIGLWIVVVIILVLGVVELATPLSITDYVLLSEKERCELQGGVWGSLGDLGEERCTQSDENEVIVCTDSIECGGYCVAQLTPEQEQDVLEGAILSVDGGVCTQTLEPGSCYPIVENGEVRSVLCAEQP